MKDSPLLKWELAPVLLPPCRRSGCSGSGSPRSTGPAAPAALVPRKRPRRPRPPLASVVAILPAPPPAKATIVAIVPRCTPPKERAPPRPAFQVLFLLSPCPPAYCKKKKKEIATFVCVFYSDLLPSPSPIENRDVGRKYLGAFFEKGSVVGVVIGLTKAREKVNQDIFLATAINETERLALSHAPSSHSITSFCCCCSISLSLFFVCSKKGGVQEENSSSAANAPAPPPPRRLKLHRSFSGLLPSFSLAFSF